MRGLETCIRDGEIRHAGGAHHTGRRNDGARAFAAWLSWLVIVPLFLSGCQPTPTPPANIGPPPPSPPPIARLNNSGIAAVLVAGDDSAAVFDNSVNMLRDLLEFAGEPSAQRRVFTSQPHHTPDVGTATIPNILQAIAAMHPPNWGTCLIFLTSHGVRNQGLLLTASDDTLPPVDLDNALQQGCGAVPTILIVSGCYSGIYAQPPLTRPNRIILTAAAPDRPSFGCEAAFMYTYFDDCLLGSLQGTANWRDIYLKTVGCVGVRERQSGVRRSNPLPWFGDSAAMTPAPWRRLLPAITEPIDFHPSRDLFSPHFLPLSPVNRTLMSDQLNYYAIAPGPKALALAPLGFVVLASQDGSGKRTDDDVARLALQRCEYLTGGGCVLYARNDMTTVLTASGLPPFHPELVRRSGKLRAEDVPFIRDDQRDQVADYLALPGPKALALSPNNTFMGIGRGPTLAAARLNALTRCEAVLSDCLVYAEDETIILGW